MSEKRVYIESVQQCELMYMFENVCGVSVDTRMLAKAKKNASVSSFEQNDRD